MNSERRGRTYDFGTTWLRWAAAVNLRFVGVNNNNESEGTESFCKK